MAEGQSRFVLRADSGQYTGEVARAEKSTRDLDKSQKGVAKSADSSAKSMDRLAESLSKGRDRLNSMSKLALAAGAALTAGLVKSGLSTVDTLAKTSDKLGITTEGLAKLRFAAQQTGVQQNELDIGLQRFTRRLADAAAGTGPAVAAFDSLGLSASELVKLKPDEALGRVADKMNLVENQSQKVSIAFKLFDSGGVSLVNTLAQGSEGLEKLGKEAEIAGLALSRVDAQKVEMANDEIAKVGSSISGFSQQLAVQFAPVLAGISERIFGIGKDSGGMAKLAEKAFKSMVKAVGVLADGVQALRIGWSLMKLGFQEAAAFIVRGLQGLSDAAVDMYNLLPWTDEVEHSRLFAGFLSTMESEIAESKNKVDALLSRPLPSTAIEEFVEKSGQAFESQAIVVQESQEIVSGALLGTEEVTKSLATSTKKAAKEVESEWDKAITGTIERVDSAFAEAWKGSFDSFSDFASGLKDAFKNMLAELAHLAITRPITVAIGGALGLGSSGAAAGGGGGIGSLFSSLSGGLGNASSSLFHNVGQGASFLADLGVPGMGSFAESSFLKSQTATGLGAGLDIGGGLVGGMLGNAAFGETSGIGSSLGGIAGSVLIPIPGVGAAIGSFLGSGLESLFGGSGKTPDRGARAKLDLSTGQLNTLGRQAGDEKFSQENFDSVQSTAAIFQAFSSAIGGSNANLDIIQGDRRGSKLNGKEFNSVADLVASGLDQILDSATDLEPMLKEILQGFNSAGAEDMLQFSSAVISLNSASGINTASQAVEDYAAAQEAAGRTVLEAYNDQTSGLRDLISNFDGSALAADELNSALITNKAAAYEMSLAIQAIGDQISGMADSSSQYFREAVMSEEELRQSRREERNRLRAELGTLTDPEEIAASAARLFELEKQIFDSLSDEIQLQRVETFAEFTESVDRVAQRQLEKAQQSLTETQTELNTQIQNMLRDTAARQQEAADTMLGAAGSFGNWVSQLQAQGITIRVDSRQSEVNA